VFRPELEGRFAARYSKFGFDVILFAGSHYSSPGVKTNSSPGVKTKVGLHSLLVKAGVEVSLRGVDSLLRDYVILQQFPLANDRDCRLCINSRRSVILDIFHITNDDYFDDSHWVIRDLISGRVLCVQSYRRSEPDEVLYHAVGKVWASLRVPVMGFTSDGHSAVSVVLDKYLRKHNSWHQWHLAINIGRVPLELHFPRTCGRGRPDRQN
jgi:hypothetical protein